MLALMLVTAINYQSSLIYLLVFVLGSIFLISIWLCFFNMHGLRIRVGNLSPVQAAKAGSLELIADAEGKERAGFYVQLDTTERVAEWNVERAPSLRLELPVNQRGVYELPPLRLATYFPFGLIRAWTWLWFARPFIVYPEPKQPPEAVAEAREEMSDAKSHQGDELSELKSFQQGDSLRKVLWRQYAKNEQLVVRSPEQLGSRKAELDWDVYKTYGLESALSFMCFDVLSLYASNQAFSLSLPNGVVLEGAGEAHRDDCLRLLAECQG